MQSQYSSWGSNRVRIWLVCICSWALRGIWLATVGGKGSRADGLLIRTSRTFLVFKGILTLLTVNPSALVESHFYSAFSKASLPLILFTLQPYKVD